MIRASKHFADDKAALRYLTQHAIVNPGVTGRKLAAMICIRGHASFIGLNSLKTDPLQSRFSKNPDAIHLHAEVHALKVALRNIEVDALRRATLYVCRVKRPEAKSKSWMWGTACPCVGCRNAIEEFGIGRVVYTLDSVDHSKFETEER